ncbi:patatin-like phospholipase family protein [Mucilaginibacter boryungensis]|uniref:Patatin-like phospholipase family protein n=1 Tax=Mucilaginibacter boryungensis TaxID=768480 RepID=A0ABR9XK96_9SPHI|nr:patatin-like phospholipase family protein [Mucilaginibacter boryungensis]MBE9667635.1 patatin-like phospholipase family protein [Mucilaginibacter boryungensis]
MGSLRFGIALSGGGYRAAGFHLGTLRKVNELGLLSKVDVLSTISGGSITGAVFCMTDQPYAEFEAEMIEALSTKSVIGYALRSWEFVRTVLLALLFIVASVALSFTHWAPLAAVPIFLLIYILVRFQFRLFPAGKVIERAYDAYFYHGAKLPALSFGPKIAIGSTNLQSARPFTFSNDYMGDSFYTKAEPPVLFVNNGFPVARAVMASSCVPFAFTPVSIAPEFFADQEQTKRIDPKLVDGGVFDNQGVHKLTQEKSRFNCDIVLVSDAGNKLPFERAYNNTFTLLLRTVDVFMARIKNVQITQNIYQNASGKDIAYVSLGWGLDKLVSGFVDNMIGGKITDALTTAHRLPAAWVADPKIFRPEITAQLEANCRFADAIPLGADRLEAIRQIGTNLTCLNKTLIEDMISHSAAMTEIQLRLYCPSLF